MFTGVSLSVNAEETSTNNADFPYTESSTYVADSIVRGIIDKKGTATGSSEISMSVTHKYFYRKIAEAVMDDGMTTFNSIFWMNIIKHSVNLC